MPVSSKFHFLLYLLMSSLVFVIDQVSKDWVQTYLLLGHSLDISRFFALVHWHNTGAAFGFLAEAGGWQHYFLSAIAIGVVCVLPYLLYKHHHDRLFCTMLALILGGALGNVYDRLRLGYVVDFLYFHYQGWYWPAFNVADSAITLAIILGICKGWMERPR